MNRSNQTKAYSNMLKEGEILLLKSEDSFFKNHYTGSPLNILTGFAGSAGEAVIDKNSKITLYVDPRYHLLVDKQIYKDINVVKMPLGQSFFDVLKKTYKKNTVLYVPSDISLELSIKLSKHFDIKTYMAESENKDYNPNSPIYQARKKGKFKADRKMLIFNPDEISYLTGLSGFQMKLSSNFKAIMYVDSEKSILFKSEKEFKKFIKNIDDEIYVDFKDITLENYLLI